MRLAVCPYRLLFKHPFGTAHGLRDGTDALFVRVEEDGIVGHGEITLPPYLKETAADARGRLAAVARLRAWDAQGLLAALDEMPMLTDAPACRAGLHTALIDALSRKVQKPAFQLIGCDEPRAGQSVLTIGICAPDEAVRRLRELPFTRALKLKVGDPQDAGRVRAVLEATEADVLLDGNQGLGTLEEAIGLAELIPAGRLIGFEQPFRPERGAWNGVLRDATGTVVFADESVQRLGDLERIDGFGGVNIKLMKCGGLDRAKQIAERAQALGLAVMLGSMSESTLGCAAMAQLAGHAAVLDLDGPWLLRNDPWQGLGWDQGRLRIPEGPGLAVEPRFELDFHDA